MILKNAQVVLKNEVIKNGYVQINNGVICSIGTMENLPLDNEIIDCENNRLFPGFIDQHIHGGYGNDFMDLEIEQISNDLLKEGTTSFLATTITNSKKAINACLEKTAQLIEQKKYGAQILGVHLEGPFINTKLKGAQPEEYIVNPNGQDLQDFVNVSKNNIRVITFAPELAQDDFYDVMKASKMIPSCGHSNSTSLELREGVKKGVKQITHFYNANTPLNHREPGIVGEGLMNESLKLEMIVDKIHIHPDVVNLTYKVRGIDNIILITDSMTAKGMSDGMYSLGGHEVIVLDAVARIASGALAGSTLKMNMALKNFFEITNCNLSELSRVSSLNAAINLGFEKTKGSIEINKDADLVLLDEDFNVLKTICRGEIK